MTTTTRSTRFDKFGWLLDNCPEKFITDSIFLTELVGWLDEDEFNKFHEHICRNWKIDSPFSEVESEEDMMVFTA